MKITLTLSLLLFSWTLYADTVVYVSERGDKKIAVYSLDEESGELTRKSEVILEGSPGALCSSGDAKYLYAAVRSPNEFITFSVESKTGALTQMAQAPAAGGAAYLFPDHTGQWALAAYYGDGKVSVSRMDGGVIIGPPVQVLDVGLKAHCIQTSPDNRFAFTPHTGDLNCVDQFAFNSTSGFLSRNSPGNLAGVDGGGPRHMQFHPNGKWVYLVNEQGRSVTHCLYDAKKGTLTRRETLSTLPEDWTEPKGSCADIEISVDGKFLYASNRGHDSVAMFRIDADSGALTSLGQAPTGKTPRSFNIIPGGERFLVSAGQADDSLTVYSRDGETGMLTQLHQIEGGSGPGWVQGMKLP